MGVAESLFKDIYIYHSFIGPSMFQFICLLNDTRVLSYETMYLLYQTIPSQSLIYSIVYVYICMSDIHVQIHIIHNFFICQLATVCWFCIVFCTILKSILAYYYVNLITIKYRLMTHSDVSLYIDCLVLSNIFHA